MFFYQDAAASTLSCKPLNLVDQWTYRGNNISSTESDVNIHIGEGVDRYWPAFDHMEIWSLW